MKSVGMGRVWVCILLYCSQIQYNHMVTPKQTRGLWGFRKILLWAMCAVVVSQTSCKDRNHPILRGVIGPHQDFFFFKNHDFSLFLINFSTVVVVKHTHVVDPKRLTHIHSHRDLNSLSLSTDSTYLLVPMP